MELLNQTKETFLLEDLQLSQTHIVHLPPEVRDQLLEYLHLWGDPQKQLQLIDELRQLHGPLLDHVQHRPRQAGRKRNPAFAQDLRA